MKPVSFSVISITVAFSFVQCATPDVHDDDHDTQCTSCEQHTPDEEHTPGAENETDETPLVASNFEIDDNTQYTVSYRNPVEVPNSGDALTMAEFRGHLRRFDPIRAYRCPLVDNAEYDKLVDQVGGVTWNNPIAILKDRSLPPLLQGKRDNLLLARVMTDAVEAATPTIERPDLVGHQNGTAIFLSKRHGLVSVDMSGSSPKVSCFLALPGRPTNFFLQQDELVLILNGLRNRGHGRPSASALLRLRIHDNGFQYIDHVLFERQEILDARLFDRTLMIYSEVYKDAHPRVLPAKSDDATGRVASTSIIAPWPWPVVQPIGMRLSAVNWDKWLEVDWDEDFVNDHVEADPLFGIDAEAIAATHRNGQIIRTYRNYHRFISASDRYLVVSRNKRDVVFTGIRTRSYRVCTDYNPKFEEVTACYPKYERQDNPDYIPPSATGAYECGGKRLADCIQEAAPKLSRYIYKRVGETCRTYWRGQCEASEWRTISYPTHKTRESTQFVVFRYVNGEFIKLDDHFYKLDPLVKSNGISASPTELKFAPKPLEVAGSIRTKNDVQFQHGHFYAVTDSGEHLHTLLIVGNSIGYLAATDIPKSRRGVSSVLFTDDRLMISGSYYNQKDRTVWSTVNMINLSKPSFPHVMTTFDMPGRSEQLILAKSGILGPGSVSFVSGHVRRNLQKLTLFDSDSAKELDNLLLGYELNSNFYQSYLGNGADDQRIRLDWKTQRLFLPYAGQHHDETAKQRTVHRLNISEVLPGKLNPEASFTLAESVVRTVSTDIDQALAFGDSSIYALTRTGQDWSLKVVNEFATPIAVYRIGDANNLVARVDRIGSTCTIVVKARTGDSKGAEEVANGEQIACSEYGLPLGIENAVVFAASETGWQVDKVTGETMTLTPDEVGKFMDKIARGIYCALDMDEQDGRPVNYLTDVPDYPIRCIRVSDAQGAGIGGPDSSTFGLVR